MPSRGAPNWGLLCYEIRILDLVLECLCGCVGCRVVRCAVCAVNKGLVWDLELPLQHQHHPHCRSKNKSTFFISKQIGNTSANAGRHTCTYINSSSQTPSPFPTPHTPHCSPMHPHTHFAKSKSVITIS